MLHLFHGELVETSRKELSKLKADFVNQEVVVLDGNTMSASDLITATESTSLFGQNRLVIIEKLFSKRLAKKSKELETWIEIIKKIPSESEVIFWEDKELSKTLLGQFPHKTDIAIFKPPKIIFTFVESIRPKHYTEMQHLFAEAVAADSAEFVFAMLVRQFRLLIMAKELGRDIGLSPWQTAKLTKQVQDFTLQSLLAHYHTLITIDERIKSGSSPFSLRESIEIFLCSLEE